MNLISVTLVESGYIQSSIRFGKKKTSFEKSEKILVNKCTSCEFTHQGRQKSADEEIQLSR